jgi:hypothetical protein
MFPSVRIFTDSVGLRSSLLCLKTGVTEDWASAFLDWARLERHLTCCSAVGANSWTATDFGPAMGKLKAEFGDSADGAVIAKILKEKLK